MNYLILLLFILFILGIKPVKPIREFYEDHLSVKSCVPWRGFFAIVVIFHHLSQVVGGDSYFYWFIPMGCIAVSLFFFYSGYGLQTKYQSDPTYGGHFLLHRLPPILIPYMVVTLFYWIGGNILGNYHSFMDALFRMISLQPIVSNSWYIICLLAFYLFWGLAMRICQNHHHMMILGGIAFVVLWIGFCKYMELGQWWYNAVPAIVVGIIWASFGEKITAYVQKHYLIIALPLFLFTVAFYFYLRNYCPEFINSNCVLTVLSPICVVVLSMKVRIGNRILQFIGNISFELYMVHGFFISAFRFISNDVLFSIAVISISIMTAYVLHRLDGILLKKLKGKSNCKNSNI